MTKTQNPTAATARQFRSKAERMFRTANSDVAATVTIEWTWTSGICKNACGDGGTFRTGRFIATAPGYKTQTVVVEANGDGSGMSVR